MRNFAVIPAFAILTAGTVSVGCTKPQAMNPSSSVPASEGTVKATKGDDGNTHVKVHVRHLAAPSNVEADSTIYMVWIQARDGANQSVGALTVSDQLEGTLETITPHRRFTLSVTPEPNVKVALPTHDAVFTAQVEVKD